MKPWALRILGASHKRTNWYIIQDYVAKLIDKTPELSVEHYSHNSISNEVHLDLLLAVKFGDVLWSLMYLKSRPFK